MNLETSGNLLIIEANVSAKNTFLYLGVGCVFIIGGVGLLSANGSRLIALLFSGLGVLTILSFAAQVNQTRLTYVFDRSTQQLKLSRGDTIPFSAIKSVSVYENTWRGTYGEPHREHSVKLSTSSQGDFMMPANSLAEANQVVEEIRRHLSWPDSSNPDSSSSD